MSVKKRIASGLCLLVLLPFVPLYLIRCALIATADGIDWAIEGRLQPVTDWIERRFGVDYETEYQAWKDRMKLRRQKDTQP